MNHFKLRHAIRSTVLATSAVLLAVSPAVGQSQAANANVPDMTGVYHFISPQDALGLLEEEGKLKGYIDVMQGADESDDVLTFDISLGSRRGDKVEFKTNRIHGIYYRFAGTLLRGAGRSDADSDFLRLEGDLTIVKVDSESGQEHPEQRHVVLKWKSKGERSQEAPEALLLTYGFES